MIGAPRIGASPAVRPFYNRGGSIPASPPTFVSDVVTALSDPVRAGPSTMSPGGITIAAGDLLVVCVGVRGCLASPTTPGVSVDGGGAPVTTLAVKTTNTSGTVDAFIFYITGAAAGSRVVTVTGAGSVGTTTPTGMSCVVYALRGAAASPLDKTAQASGLGASGPYVAGPTPALSVPNQFDITALALGEAGTEDPRPWVAPFVFRDAGVPFTDPTTDVSTWCADRTSLTTAAVTATSGTPVDPLDYGVVVATFKGA